MTNEAAAPAQDSNAQSKNAQSKTAQYARVWADSFSQVVGQIAGTAVPCVVSADAPASLPPASADDLWVLITSTGALRGEMRLGLSGATVLRLGQTFMSEPAAPEVPLTADHREAVIELFRQVAGIVAGAAKGPWGEIQFATELSPSVPSWPPAETFWLQAGEPSSALIAMTMELGLSSALAAELRAAKPEASKSVPLPPAAALPDSAPGGALNLLLDVPLAVTMRFGSRRLLLSEVLDLSPGAVVELDRRVQDPVDLLLDGRLVAHGEVVIIDGNYGLRVTEVFPDSQPRPRRQG